MSVNPFTPTYGTFHELKRSDLSEPLVVMPLGQKTDGIARALMPMAVEKAPGSKPGLMADKWKHFPSALAYRTLTRAFEMVKETSRLGLAVLTAAEISGFLDLTVQTLANIKLTLDAYCSTTSPYSYKEDGLILPVTGSGLVLRDLFQNALVSPETLLGAAAGLWLLTHTASPFVLGRLNQAEQRHLDQMRRETDKVGRAALSENTQLITKAQKGNFAIEYLMPILFDGGEYAITLTVLQNLKGIQFAWSPEHQIAMGDSNFSFYSNFKVDPSVEMSPGERLFPVETVYSFLGAGVLLYLTQSVLGLYNDARSDNNCCKWSASQWKNFLLAMLCRGSRKGCELTKDMLGAAAFLTTLGKISGLFNLTTQTTTKVLIEANATCAGYSPLSLQQQVSMPDPPLSLEQTFDAFETLSIEDLTWISNIGYLIAHSVTPFITRSLRSAEENYLSKFRGEEKKRKLGQKKCCSWIAESMKSFILSPKNATPKNSKAAIANFLIEYGMPCLKAGFFGAFSHLFFDVSNLILPSDGSQSELLGTPPFTAGISFNTTGAEITLRQEPGLVPDAILPIFIPLFLLLLAIQGACGLYDELQKPQKK